MLIIRLSRKGKKKEPIYRIIVSEKTKDTKGNYLESLGFYNPKTKEISLNDERIKHWLSKGVQLSDTVNNLFINNNVIEGDKIRKGRTAKKNGKDSKEEGATTKPEDTPEEKAAPKAEKKPEKKEEEKEKKDEPKKEEKAEPSKKEEKK